jgi:hypothetical protein
MQLFIHVPMFATAHVDSQRIECPYCPRGKEFGTNDWQERDISTCNPFDEFICNRCGKSVFINWGLVEPDHLSTWMNSEHCPHRLCRLKYAELCRENGWAVPT